MSAKPLPEVLHLLTPLENTVNAFLNSTEPAHNRAILFERELQRVMSTPSVGQPDLTAQRSIARSCSEAAGNLGATLGPALPYLPDCQESLERLEQTLTFEVGDNSLMNLMTELTEVNRARTKILGHVQNLQREIIKRITYFSRAKHSADFRTVNWFGTQYVFTKTQAKCVEILWDAWLHGGQALNGTTILAKADTAGERFDAVFRKKQRGRSSIHPAMGTMIARIDKDLYRLAAPSLEDSDE